eukprot:6488993-Amphidinium_carterae.1
MGFSILSHAYLASHAAVKQQKSECIPTIPNNAPSHSRVYRKQTRTARSSMAANACCLSFPGRVSPKLPMALLEPHLLAWDCRPNLQKTRAKFLQE